MGLEFLQQWDAKSQMTDLHLTEDVCHSRICWGVMKTSVKMDIDSVDNVDSQRQMSTVD